MKSAFLAGCFDHCLGHCKLLQDSSIRVWSLHCTFGPVQKTCLPLLLQEAWPCNCMQAHRPWSAKCGFLNATSSWILTSDLKPFICYLKPIPALCQGAAHGARAIGRFLLAWWHWAANIAMNFQAETSQNWAWDPASDTQHWYGHNFANRHLLLQPSIRLTRTWS